MFNATSSLAFLLINKFSLSIKHKLCRVREIAQLVRCWGEPQNISKRLDMVTYVLAIPELEGRETGRSLKINSLGKNQAYEKSAFFKIDSNLSNYI